MKKTLLLSLSLLTLGWCEPEADPQIPLDGEGVGCGAPRFLPEWNNVTIVEGEPVKVSCPLDTQNSCLIDLVEWYRSPYQGLSGRSLLRDAAVKFDPLLLYINEARNEHSGWYTCIVANAQGRNEATTYIKIMPNRGRSNPGMQMNIRRVHNRQHRARIPVQTQPAPLVRKPTEFVENVQWMEFDPEQERREIEAEQQQQQHQQRQQQQRGRSLDESVNAGRLEGTMKQQQGGSGGGPVYSRYRGHRGFSGQTPRLTEIHPQAARTTAAPILMQHQRQQQQSGSIQSGQIEAVHQHLRYIYEKLESMQDKFDEINLRLSQLELRSSTRN